MGVDADRRGDLDVPVTGQSASGAGAAGRYSDDKLANAATVAPSTDPRRGEAGVSRVPACGRPADTITASANNVPPVGLEPTLAGF